jgi:aryl-alcohol dehydrogenase-like predicted oxidoreductase
MIPFYLKYNISLLAFGTMCGGLLSERWLGKIQPSTIELDTLSLRKYMKMIDARGGWNLFQDLLSTLTRIAQKHNVSIANVAEFLIATDASSFQDSTPVAIEQ